VTTDNGSEQEARDREDQDHAHKEASKDNERQSKDDVANIICNVKTDKRGDTAEDTRVNTKEELHGITILGYYKQPSY
jgi:hypothetical protein